MRTAITTSLPQDDLSELDRVRRYQGLSRAEAVRTAVQWYVSTGGQLPTAHDLVDETW
jgi:metal-responsive CopG/Arc/MetJ family transcriptional regulator